MKRNSISEKYNKICKIYFDWLKRSKKSQSTLELYSNVLNMFDEYLQCDKFPGFYGDDINADTVLSWKQSLVTKNFKQNTIRTYLIVLRSFFEWTVQNNYYLHSPFDEIGIPESINSTHSMLSDDEIKTLLFEKPELIRKNNNLERNRAIVVLILQCGLKVSEIIKLKYENLDFQNSLIHIPSENSVNLFNSVLIYRTSKQCIEEYIIQVKALRSIGNADYLFGQYIDKESKPFTRQHIANIIKSYVNLSIGRSDINSDDLLWAYKNSLILQRGRKEVTINTVNNIFDKLTVPLNKEDMSNKNYNSVQSDESGKIKDTNTLKKNETGVDNAHSASTAIRHGKQLTISEYAYSPDEILSNSEIFDEELKDFDNESKNIRMKKIDNLDGYEFQDYIADLFQKLGYDASVNNKAYDWGVDIIVKNEFFSLGIQCKLSNKEPIDNEAVQEIVAGIRHYGLDKGMVITNNYFHNTTRQLAKENNVLLWDRDDLNKKISEFADISED